MKKLIYLSIAFALMFALSSFGMQQNDLATLPVSIEKDTFITQVFIFKVKKYTADGASEKVYYEFETIDYLERAGYIKTKSGFANHHRDEDGFIVVFFNAKNEEIHSVEVANPLIKHFEVAEEDGTLKRERVDVDEEIISVRINQLKDFDNLKVYTLKEDGKGDLVNVVPMTEIRND
jgi:hypothetical protein